MLFGLIFYMNAYTMNPDQTAPKGAVWSESILLAIQATYEHEQTQGADNKICDL